MKGLRSGTFEQIKNPGDFRKTIQKIDEERETSWGGEIEHFRKTAEKMYEDHLLVQRAKEEAGELLGDVESILEVPKEYFKKISDKTGYQEGLIAAVYQIAWERMQEEKTRRRYKFH